MKVFVEHRGYGCGTGCCGHTVTIEADDGTERSKFDFISHPYGDDARAFAEEMVTDAFGAEHVADLDWDRCIIIDD